MASYQKIVLVGNLSTDVELRHTPAGQAVASFGLATNDRWTSNGEAKEQVTWWRVTAWGKQAESCNQYLMKGRSVLIEGKMTPDRETGQPRIWTGNDGNARASYEINAQIVQFLGGGNGAGGNGHGEAFDSTPVDEDSIPF